MKCNIYIGSNDTCLIVPCDDEKILEEILKKETTQQGKPKIHIRNIIVSENTTILYVKDHLQEILESINKNKYYKDKAPSGWLGSSPID